MSNFQPRVKVPPTLHILSRVSVSKDQVVSDLTEFLNPSRASEDAESAAPAEVLATALTRNENIIGQLKRLMDSLNGIERVPAPTPVLSISNGFSKSHVTFDDNDEQQASVVAGTKRKAEDGKLSKQERKKLKKERRKSEKAAKAEKRKAEKEEEESEDENDDEEDSD